MFLFIFLYFCGGAGLYLSGQLWLIPLLMLQVSLLGMGFGILVSALTTKYRDLQVLVGFGLQIWMYGTPVIYATSMIPARYDWIIKWNPVAPPLLLFKSIFFGTDKVAGIDWGISWIITFLVLFLGIVVFNQVERNFMDTI